MKYPNFEEEIKAFSKGYDYVIGIDEVGRGCFAGPVTVGAVAVNKNYDFEGQIKELTEINDSKLLKPLKRLKLSKQIREKFFYSSIVTIPVSVINNKGIGEATKTGFRKIIAQISKQLKDEKNYILIDGFYVKYIKGIGLKNQKAIVKGDQKCITIAAASIIAKVHRDKLMKGFHKKYPAYHFSKNKGYGTKEHQRAIKQFGLSQIHRKSFNLEKFT
ncbi:ribonuclease HII [Candidatus Microgenomates bacterium]|nr:MAG: ribonuclease HII [Candidatus Microgenomates bacterium]